LCNSCWVYVIVENACVGLRCIIVRTWLNSEALTKLVDSLTANKALCTSVRTTDARAAHGRRSVFSTTHGSTETEPHTKRELRQPIARRKTASHPLFSLDFRRRTLQRNQMSELVRNLLMPTWPRDWPVASITSHRDPNGPTAPPQARCFTCSGGFAMSSRRIARLP
jgi:hypothetical protein